MSKYLARLNAIIHEKPLPNQVPKVPQAPFVTFGTDRGRVVFGIDTQTEPDEVASSVTSRTPWWPKPHPRIVREPPFGSDAAPARYREAWDGLLAQCPAEMAPFVWETAICDAARLFGDFGVELERLAWKPADLFGMPHGIVWFIKGNYAAAIGATMAQLGNGRIWRRARSKNVLGGET
jgi:hypothetical protein